MIYYDQTEGRANSRLPPVVIEAGLPVVGLEPATGADLLITEREGLAGNVNRPPGSVMLPMYIEHGFLVQRKSGSDFLNSIPELTNILWRMRMASKETIALPWLLVCGEFRPSSDGHVICEGRETGWTWHSIEALKESWQMMGGFISFQPSDYWCGETILRWDRKGAVWAKDMERGFVEKPSVPEATWGPNKWRETLMTFPNCGDVMSDRIARHAGRLCDALVWMSEVTSYGVQGVGQKTLERFRQHFGLQDNEHFAIWVDEPTIHGPEPEVPDDL
jgi:hypothetical protein